jgi:hypothetical protein
MSKKSSLLLSSGLAVLVAIALVLFLRPSGPKGAALSSREEAMQLLGSTLAQLRPGSPVLVLSNPFAQDSGFLDEKTQFERAGLRGLKEGLGKSTRVTVVAPDIRPEYYTNPSSIFIAPDSKTPLSFLVLPESLDRLAASHPDCQVLVSLIGLPVGVETLKVWDPQDPRSLALLLPDLRVLGSPGKAAEAFQRGKILAAVVEDTQPGTFLVVTATNILEVLEKQPSRLGF